MTARRAREVRRIKRSVPRARVDGKHVRVTQLGNEVRFRNAVNGRRFEVTFGEVGLQFPNFDLAPLGDPRFTSPTFGGAPSLVMFSDEVPPPEGWVWTPLRFITNPSVEL